MKALILEDQVMFRDLLGTLLRDRLKFSEITHTGTCAEAREHFSPRAYDLVAMDLDLPDGDGLDLAREFTSADPHLRVVAISSRIDEHTLSRVVESGAMAFIDKTADDLKRLESALRDVMDWRMYFSRSVHDIQIRQREDPQSYAKVLTEKELAMLKLFGLGLSNQDIADREGVELSTIQGHRKSVMRKLQVGTSLELMRFAIAKGFTRVSDIHRQLAAD
jgi:DNA-binding NarL/FixJ family response regulator